MVGQLLKVMFSFLLLKVTMFVFDLKSLLYFS